MTDRVPEVTTSRLRLRGWRESDRDELAVLNADPVVMEYFPEPLSRAQSDAVFDKWQRNWAEHGYGFWRAETRADGKLVGIIGLGYANFEAAFTPVVEVGWRLAVDYWGQGLATEGAFACLRFGFDTTDAESIVAVTSALNIRSQRVMRRLGMDHEPALDFEHPNVPEGHRLRPHVLYRIARTAFSENGRPA